MAFKIRHIYDTIFAMKFTGIVHGVVYGVVHGVVQKGDGLGAKIGFPTINLEGSSVGFSHGVYLVEVEVSQGAGKFVGVMHYGPRPSVGARVSVGGGAGGAGGTGGHGIAADPSEIRLEIHLLDFSGDLYGKTVTVVVLDKIREVMCFSSLEELKARIAEDILLARARVYGP
jgi:riboflavin kinase/FMN adenylyltransferase